MIWLAMALAAFVEGASAIWIRSPRPIASTRAAVTPQKFSANIRSKWASSEASKHRASRLSLRLRAERMNANNVNSSSNANKPHIRLGSSVLQSVPQSIEAR